MIKGLVRWVLYALTLMLIATIITGISIEDFITAMYACVIIAIINTLIKPIIKLITLPINIITLGLFSLIINALLFMLAGAITPGVSIDGFLSAFYGSVILSAASYIINMI